MANVKPHERTREDQVAYAIKCMRKAKAALASATGGLPDAWADEVVRLAVDRAEREGGCSMAKCRAEALEIARDSLRAYHAMAAGRRELSEQRSKGGPLARYAVAARKRYL